MQDLFLIDGIRFDVGIVKLSREGVVNDGENAGRTLDYVMHRDVKGTLYNYSLTVGTKSLSASDYDELYEVLTAPVDSHLVRLPYGQGSKTVQMYVTSVKDELLRSRDGVKTWGNLSFSFIAMELERSP